MKASSSLKKEALFVRGRADVIRPDIDVRICV